VGVGESGIGDTATTDGLRIIFACIDLGGKDPIEAFRESVSFDEGKGDSVLFEDPVEATPDLAAIEFFRLLRGREGLEKLDQGKNNGEVGRMFVERVVGIEGMGVAKREESMDVLNPFFLFEGEITFDDRGGVLKHEEGVVLSDSCGFLLFIDPNFDHLFGGHSGERAGFNAS
jgi:hypothetical protein